jgi:DNA topoisomerase-1
LEKFTLIITEKPDAANRIASALDANGKAKKIMENGVPYYEAQRDGKIIVVPALGHLYTVTGETGKRNQYPVFNHKWVPLHEAQRGAERIRIWLRTISKLSKEADAFVDACDYDIEGSIIVYCLLKYACGNKESTSKRMKYSTLTKEELEKSYLSLLPNLDFGLIEAGLTRHELDWLYGINLSRALTIAAKNSSGYYTNLTTGRVQGPTLKFLVLRERRIASFVPIPYWTVKAQATIGKAIFEADHKKKTINLKEEADAIVKVCEGKNGKIERLETRKFTQLPPLPFDLGSLQSEAYIIFGYTPMRTSSITQQLYLGALISYPRTGSQKLPPEIGYETILKNLAKHREYTKLAGELLSKSTLTPTEGKKTDSAHPAIYPTGKLPGKALTMPEKNIWDLVVRRFMAVFGEPAMRQTVEIIIDIGGEKFLLRGKQTLEAGWLRFYLPFSRMDDKLLPVMKEGQVVNVKKITLEDNFTKPPPRYNPRTLLKKMEEGGIGTKATRAGIIQTLYDRKYICDQKITVTELGFEVTNVLKKYCPAVVSVEFTRKLEEKMTLVQLGTESRNNILSEAIEILKPVTASLKENEKAIGEQLSFAVKKAKMDEKTIGSCPTCHSGKLVIIHSKKTKKRFAGCTNYFKGTCKTAFPLPQKGFVKPTDKVCRGCNWPTVQVWLKGKHPWTLCFNSQCSTKTKEEKH